VSPGAVGAALVQTGVRLALVLWLVGAAASPAAAAITFIEIRRTEPFAGGATFGGTGAYVKVVGVAHGELDPAIPGNRGIVNLERAPRNERGRVEYDVDFYVLSPADSSRGNRRILYEVTNRGRKLLFAWLHDAGEASALALNDPSSPEHAGIGFALRLGYTLVWSGWDPDAPAANGGLRIRVPIATDGDKPIVRTIRDEFVFGTRLPAASPTAPLSYEAATLQQASARLTVRARETDAPAEVHRLYLLAGTQHAGRPNTPPDPGHCRLARNAHSAAPALRALLVALDAWVVDGTRPPRNRIPLLRDATLVDAARLGFPAIPGTEAPRAANRIAPFDDWVAPKPDTARAYVTLVFNKHKTANEMTGIRLPGVAAPLGTHTGWNFYRAPQLAGELCDRDGTFVPFAVTKAEREAAKDPRLSLEERYKDHKGWLAYVRAVAYDLMRERALLKEDGDRIVAAAEAADPFKR